jgi:hypothetical protein
MTSNYEWQRHHTRERIQARLREAELHRLARQGKDRVPHAGPARRRVNRTLMLVGAALALLLAAAILLPQIAAADNGLIQTRLPSTGQPGQPFCAPVEPASPTLRAANCEWATIIIGRDSSVAPVSWVRPPGPVEGTRSAGRDPVWAASSSSSRTKAR